MRTGDDAGHTLHGRVGVRARPSAAGADDSGSFLTAQFDEYRRTVALLERRTAAGSGATPTISRSESLRCAGRWFMAVLDRPTDVAKRMYLALDFIEAGMPLDLTAKVNLLNCQFCDLSLHASSVRSSHRVLPLPRSRRYRTLMSPRSGYLQCSWRCPRCN